MSDGSMTGSQKKIRQLWRKLETREIGMRFGSNSFYCTIITVFLSIIILQIRGMFIEEEVGKCGQEFSEVSYNFFAKYKIIPVLKLAKMT